MAKQLYDYWFVQFDFPNKEGKPYKSSGGKMVWNDKLKREIPEGWYCGTLLDIAQYTNGLACQKFRPTDDDKLPVIKIKEMHDGITPETEYVRSNIPDAVKVFDGDVLFSWSASLEVMLWAYGRGGLNQHIFKVTSNNGYPRSFYFYQLLDYIGNFKRMAEARKTTMGHITQDHLRQSTIALPHNTAITNKLEDKIAPIFDCIVRNSQEIMSLTKQRDELLPLLMNGQVSVNYDLAECNLIIFTKNLIFVKDLKCIFMARYKLKDCFLLIKNGAVIQQRKEAAGYPITRIETLSNGRFNRDRMGYADIFDITPYTDYILDDYDILMSHINSREFLGRTVLYRKEGDESIIHGMNVLRIKTNPALFDAEYANYFFQTAYFKKLIDSIRKDAINQSSIAISDICGLEIDLPSIEEQRQIAAVLSRIDRKISINRAINHNLPTPVHSLVMATARHAV